MDITYDAVIIGTGQGGMPLALDLAEAGWKTVIIERAAVGGTCINYGCTPTKSMVSSAREAFTAGRGKDFGIKIGSIAVNMPGVRKRKERIVTEFSDGSREHLQKTKNLDLIFGEASFISTNQLQVKKPDGVIGKLKAEKFFINTGGRPAIPHIPGLDKVAWLDSTTIMNLDEVPRTLAIFGGGYVALEFAQMFRRFGSEVIVLERSPQFLPREDADISETLKILKEDGIKVKLGVTIESVETASKGTTVHLSKGKVKASHILVATGRVPNTESLNLSAANVETDAHGYVQANERLETSAKNIWAIGDVKGGPAFTHISYDDYRVLRRNLLEGGGGTTLGRYVPYVIFTDPQLGRVGLTEREAKADGLKVTIKILPASSISRAVETSESRGMLKAIVDSKTDKVLGFTALIAEGGELMSAVQLAMMGGLTARQLNNGIFAHPTWSEALNNLFAS